MPRTADDDVIVKRDLEPFARFHDGARDAQIVGARAWIAGWMIMREDEAGRAEIERAPDDLAREDIRPIDRAADRDIVAQQPVFRVEIQDADLLGRLMRQMREQIVQHGAAARQDRTRLQFDLQRFQHGRPGRQDHLARIRIGFELFGQRLAVCPEDGGQGSEVGDERAGDRPRLGATDRPDQPGERVAITFSWRCR